MNLLTFAHRGEAQHFIKVDNYQPVEFSFNGLFNNKENYLLITGEGLESTHERMNIVLKNIEEQISTVINYGIAGSLDKDLELESVHRINLILKEDENKTFQSANKNSKTNCISALNRVHDINYRNKLAQRAQIVDRELWAVADICHSFNLPILSVKLMSDYAGKTTDTKRLIKKAKEYSRKLYEYYIDY